ncbi:MAG: AI-2E family transporter, partial [Alistipes sp.]|nr:AI-2E family transporter [Candidatus Minthomonas equi]
MENSGKIWKYVGWTAAVAAVCLICWYFRSILIYLACAIVISLIGHPLKKLLCKIRIGRFAFPEWLAPICVIGMIFAFIVALIMLVSPLAMKITEQISSLNPDSLAISLDSINGWIRDNFASAGPDFKMEEVILTQVASLLSVGTVSGVVSSVSTFLVNAAIGLFSVAFMSFFFIADDNLLTRITVFLAPDRFESRVRRTITRTTRLLSRYFIGLVIESLLIMVLNGVGLTFIAGMEFSTAVVVAVLTGVFNVIPYVGPLTGEALAVVMGLITHYRSAFSGSIGWFLTVVLLVCLFTQLIDNYVFQPVIYSNSVKAHPLEIFVVILMAATLWGVFGMLVAVPVYTVIRVILSEVFPDSKIGRLLNANM